MRKLLQHSFIRDYGISLGAVLAAIVLLLISVRPAVEKILELREEHQVAQETLTTLSAKLQKLEELAAKADILDKEFEQFDRAIPSESDVPAILTQIQAIATHAGATITALQFSEGVGVVAGTEGGEAGQRRFSEIRIKFASESSFDNLVQLLKTFETAIRIIDLESLRYTTEAEKQVGADLTLLAYYTSKPKLLPETPITFDLADPTFERNSKALQRLVPY